MKHWISGRSAAKQLGVSHATVSRWVTTGKLAPVGYVDGVSAVFDPEEIAKYARYLKANRPRRGKPSVLDTFTQQCAEFDEATGEPPT